MSSIFFPLWHITFWRFQYQRESHSPRHIDRFYDNLVIWLESSTGWAAGLWLNMLHRFTLNSQVGRFRNLSLFAVVLVCYCREPVSLPTCLLWMCYLLRAGLVILLALISLFALFLHPKVNFEKDCNMYTSVCFFFLKGFKCCLSIYTAQ